MYHNVTVKFKPNDIINDIKIISFYRPGEGAINFYNCKCLKCNKLFLARERDIENGIVRSCFKCSNEYGKHVYQDISNKKFNLLTALEVSHITVPSIRVYWVCKCDCGNYTITHTRALQIGECKSCGCFSLLRKLNNKLHGLSNTQFYRIWAHMKQRCLNPNNDNYFRYGGRGITLYKPWEVFDNFKNDKYEEYLEHVKIFGEADTSIDRIDSNKGYCPENTRFATHKVQSNNIRRNIQYELNGHFYKPYQLLDTICHETIDSICLNLRMRRYGFDIIEACARPVDMNASHNGLIKDGKQGRYDQLIEMKNRVIKYPIKELNDNFKKQIYEDTLIELNKRGKLLWNINS